MLDTKGDDIARCPHCGKILADEWMRHEGAALLGKHGGTAKARASEQASHASITRWKRPGERERVRKMALRKAEQKAALERAKNKKG